MDKDFFQSIEQRIKDFRERGNVGDQVRTEVVLVNGRGYVVEKVVEAADGWLQFDGHHADDAENPVSLVLPYHQVSHLLFSKQRARMRQAGFGRS